MLGYDTLDVSPHEWRRIFAPVGAAWSAALGLTVYFGHPQWADMWLEDTRLRVGLTATPWSAVIAVLAAAFIGWLAGGVGALVGATLLERFLLRRWSRLGRPLVRLRQHRWDLLTQRIHQVAESDPDTALRHMRRRTMIALTRPSAATWLADRWAAAEARIQGAYGLDLRSTWPRLWLTMPETARAELRIAAAAWHSACLWWCWALLFASLGPIWWPSLLVAFVMALFARSRLRRSLIARAELIESCYDMYATDLAARMSVALKQPGPLDPAKGREITALIRKGS